MPEPNNNGGDATPNNNGTVPNTTGTNNQVPNSSEGIDYNKIQEIINSKNARTEENILKGYFQKQGLSETEMQSAIESFKASKAQKLQEQNQNNLNLQTENTELKAKVQKMEIKDKAKDIAGELGIDAKTVPYLLKMADLSNAVDGEGKISDEAIKTALNDVLEALPQLKSQVQEGNNGFQKVGGDNNDKQPNVEDTLKEIFK